MNNDTENLRLDRRTAFTGIGAGLALVFSSQTKAASPEAVPALEVEKEKIVNDFCAAWATRDADQLVSYLSDDIEYHMFEGRPPINGVAEFSAQLKPFMAGMTEIDWEMLRSSVMGDIVINERIDHFIRAEGSGAPDNHFHVIGIFLVRGGKIVYWKDYNLSGEL
ncbi:MAG: limonene-1,2-epoxide hydrolase family protein [Rhodospirillaceae bacterium]